MKSRLADKPKDVHNLCCTYKQEVVKLTVCLANFRIQYKSYKYNLKSIGI